MRVDHISVANESCQTTAAGVSWLWESDPAPFCRLCVYVVINKRSFEPFMRLDHISVANESCQTTAAGVPGLWESDPAPFCRLDNQGRSAGSSRRADDVRYPNLSLLPSRASLT